MVPVGEREDYLFVVKVFVWGVWVVDDEGTAKTIGILSSRVTVIPICARLVDLKNSQLKTWNILF